MESLRRSGPKARGWVLWEYDTAQNTHGIYPQREFTSSKVLTSFDCANHTKAIIKEILFNTDVESVYEANFADDPKNYTEPAPDTVMDEVLKYVFRPKNKKR